MIKDFAQCLFKDEAVQETVKQLLVKCGDIFMLFESWKLLEKLLDCNNVISPTCYMHMERYLLLETHSGYTHLAFPSFTSY